jgi:transcriptional regulator with XRE-family HTH domain
MTTTPISERIRALMQRNHVSDAELARQIGVPQATISRIMSGETKDPRISTLTGIARVLGTTIDDLAGDSGGSIPQLEWHEIMPFIKTGHVEEQRRVRISVSAEILPGSFAVRATPSMAPRYREGSTLIVQPLKVYRDFQVALISIDEGEPCVRRIVRDGPDLRLKKLNDAVDVAPTPLTDNAQIVGIVTEMRIVE